MVAVNHRRESSVCLQVRKALGVEDRPAWQVCDDDVYQNFSADWMLDVRPPRPPAPLLLIPSRVPLPSTPPCLIPRS